jgi:hypothetical protein
VWWQRYGTRGRRFFNGSSLYFSGCCWVSSAWLLNNSAAAIVSVPIRNHFSLDTALLVRLGARLRSMIGS